MTSCELCDNSIAPYKCPTCRIRYCSIDCFKSHRASTCTPTIPNLEKSPKIDKTETVYRYPTEDTVPTDKLAALRDSSELKNCLNNPHVRKIMEGILEAEDPTEAIARAMGEPIFVELADACLRVVEPPDEAESMD